MPRSGKLRCRNSPSGSSSAYFMLLDEPMSHLDERNAAVMAGILLEEVRTNGTGVIVTSVGKRFEIEYDKVFSL